MKTAYSSTAGRKNPIEEIVLDNVRIQIGKRMRWPGGFYETRPGIYKGVYGHKAAGAFIQHRCGVELPDVKVISDHNPLDYFGPALKVHDVTGLELDRFKSTTAEAIKLGVYWIDVSVSGKVSRTQHRICCRPRCSRTE